MSSRAMLAATCLGLGSICVPAAHAQDYPNQTITIIAPFPAGGVVDSVARRLGSELSKSLGQPVIIDNRPGAGGNVGADVVANASPDGYTLMMTSPGIMSINQFLYEDMPFDPETAFTPVSLVADMPMLLVLGETTDAQDVAEFIEAAKAAPDALTFGSAGFGTTPHLGLELLNATAGVELFHTPYSGAAPAVNDLVGAHIDGVVENPPTVLNHIHSGTLRALAVAGENRLPQLPDVPTAAEAGLPDWLISSWFGLVAPADTPSEIVERLQEEVRASIDQPSMTEFSDQVGIVLVGGTPEEFADLIASERERWGNLIAEAGITLQ